MRVGLSLSRCVRDIVDGRVSVDDVLIIIARTSFDPHNDEHWQHIWQGYGGGGGPNYAWTRAEWGHYSNEDEDRVRSVIIELHESGRLFQPRVDANHMPRRWPYYWLETVLTNEDMASRPAVQAAWDQFQLLASLTGTVPTDTKGT